MENNKIANVEAKEVIFSSDEITVQGIADTLTMIYDLMETTMKKGIDFDVIPGCGDKPALLQPGAIKVKSLFNLGHSFELVHTDLGGGHREYQCIVTLYSRKSSNPVGSGVGVCTTMESKWRYRWDNTEKQVPKEYWDTRNSQILGGRQYAPRKKGKVWVIFEKIEHDNPADYYNTCAKMAEKRGLVDATSKAVPGIADLFTQDIEENPELFGGDPPQEQEEKEQETPEPTKKKKFTKDQLLLLDKTGKMLLEMAQNDKNLAGDLLVQFTEWVAGDGKNVKGKSSLFDLSPKQVTPTYGKVKKAHEKFINERDAKDTPGQSQEEIYGDIPF